MTDTNMKTNENLDEIEATPQRKSRKNPNKIKASKVDVSIGFISIALLVFLALLIIFPLLNFFSFSLTDSAKNGSVTFFPRGWTLWAFKYVLAGEEAATFWRSFLNSVIITVIVTIGSNLVEAMAAYPLSKRDCPFRGGIMMYFIITMLFSAGVIPIYLLMHYMHLTNTIWSIILISISNVSNLLFFKTFFEGLPNDLEDAARIDGASEIQMFMKIVIPMSLPVIGTCCFFTIVGMWNGYGGALLFIDSSATTQQPLAYYIYLMISRFNNLTNNAAPELRMGVKNIQSAAMLVSIIPILCIYPYIINYIKNGLTIGSVKE